MLIPLLAFVLWKAGLPGRAWVLLAGAGGVSLTNLTLKHLIDRPRPGGKLFPAYIDLDSPGFPSGHVVLFVTCFGYLILLAWKHLSGSLRTVVTGRPGFFDPGRRDLPCLAGRALAPRLCRGVPSRNSDGRCNLVT